MYYTCVGHRANARGIAGRAWCGGAIIAPILGYFRADLVGSFANARAGQGTRDTTDDGPNRATNRANGCTRRGTAQGTDARAQATALRAASA